MPERKTQQSKASVREFLRAVPNETRRSDAQAVARIMAAASGKRAKMWGPSIIGYGIHRYKLASGKEAEICRIGFSPRVSALAFYLPRFRGKPALLKNLGKHRTGVGCLYINKLADVDVEVLTEIIEKSWSAGD